MSTSLSQRKSFEISKWEVWQAYQRVKANKGAPGTDGVSIEDFETDLQGNLYKVWNRMSRLGKCPEQQGHSQSNRPRHHRSRCGKRD